MVHSAARNLTEFVLICRSAHVKHFEIPRAPRSDCKVVRRKIEFRVREYRCIDYFQSATIFEMKNIKRNPNHSTHVSFVSVAAKSAKITPRTSPPSTVARVTHLHRHCRGISA